MTLTSRPLRDTRTSRRRRWLIGRCPHESSTQTATFRIGILEGWLCMDSMSTITLPVAKTLPRGRSIGFLPPTPSRGCASLLGAVDRTSQFRAFGRRASDVFSDFGEAGGDVVDAGRSCLVGESEPPDPAQHPPGVAGSASASPQPG